VRRFARPLLGAAVLALALVVAATRVGPLPPLGALLDPARGAWALARTAELPRTATATIPGLHAGVDVRYDDRGVPHIFAKTPDDAYRALGYVVARDRLFQLDVQTRAAAGTLTEMLGKRLADVDLETRRQGMPWSARRKLALLDSASDAGRAFRAYADGINAWIDAMPPAALPLEYRLVGARPAHWSPINTIHLLNRMALTLSFQTEDLDRLAAEALVGRVAADALWPLNNPIQEPIQPVERRGPTVDRSRLPPPGQPDSGSLLALASIRRELATSTRDASSDDELAIGSNNWAVAPQNTRDGHALLAGDPHLDLTLPSIWYEAHLVVPGVMDVYGVTLPGAPWVIIGFNRDIAWSLTNTGSDVVDFYRETVDDSVRPSRYLLDGRWLSLEREVDTLRGPGSRVIAVDTILFNHRGPLTRQQGRWLSLRWLALEPSADLDVFPRAARSRSADEFMDAFAPFAGPAQNTLVADRGGTIAIRSTGKMPIRPGDGLGTRIRDGSTRASDWRGFLPISAYPFSRNPRQGYLASANQQPMDPRASAAYFGANWFPPWRALRINQLLRADWSVTPEAMRRFQTDPGSPRADVFVPEILAAVQRVERSGRGDSLLHRAAALLSEWDRRYTRDNERAVLFERTMSERAARTWDELRPSGSAERVWTPPSSTLYRLLADSGSAWWDDRSTANTRERRDDIVTASLRAALTKTIDAHGDPAAGGWRWSRVQQANIYHLLRIPALSALDLPVQGGPVTLSPSQGRGTEGASWRMVVELGPTVRAWGTYPGGQSGNPASVRYTDRLPQWLSGELSPLLTPTMADSLGRQHTSAVLSLSPRR
jgi:penicillin amidase